MNDNFWNTFNTRTGALDALARVDLLAGDPALDRRLAVLADVDPLGLRIPRRASPGCCPAISRDRVSPEHYRIPASQPRKRGAGMARGSRCVTSAGLPSA